jgi:hypothetical protein
MWDSPTSFTQKNQQTIVACKANKTQGQYQLLHKKLLC